MSGDKPTWLGYAEADLNSARTLIAMTDPPWHLVAYLSQQCAEKPLKAFLISMGWSLKKTHDLAELLDHAKVHDGSLSALDHDADLLNSFAQAGRYPLFQVTRSDAERALLAADRVSPEVIRRLGGLRL
jgi:HEPN domain-containing protein